MFAHHQENGAPSYPPAPLLDVLGQPGTVRVHVHDYQAMDVPSQSPQKRRTYPHRAERALVLARKGDVVVLATRPDPAFIEYLGELGAGPDPDAILVLQDHAGGSVDCGTFARLRNDQALIEYAAAGIAERLSGGAQPLLTSYCSVHLLEPLRAALSCRLGRSVIADGPTEQAVCLANRKDRIRAAASRLGIPVAAGVAIGDDGGVGEHGSLVESIVLAAERQCSATGGAIVRGAWSSSGADVRMIRGSTSVGDLAPWLEQRAHLRDFLVEELLDAASSPNVQAWVCEDAAVRLISTTNQRLGTNGRHFGNVYPFHSPLLPDMQRATIAIGEFLAAHGYRGPMGVDLVEVAGHHRFAFVEANGRMNASTYACALFESINQRRQAYGHAPFRAWISRADATIRVTDFATLLTRLGDLAYTDGQTASAGVVVYNTGLIPFGSVDLLAVGESVEHVEQIERSALARLAR